MFEHELKHTITFQDHQRELPNQTICIKHNPQAMINCSNCLSSLRKIVFLFLFRIALFHHDVFIRAFVINTSSTTSIIQTSMSTRVNFSKDPSRLSDLSDFGATNFDELEKEVYASTQYKMDVQRLKNTLVEKESSSSVKDDPQKTAIMAAQWKISLAAASFVSTFFEVSTKSNLSITALVFVTVFFVANQDPLEEEGAAGALARLLGRVTIQSVETSKPKLKAIARAAISTGDDDRKEVINLLQQRIEVLEDENTKLKQWKEQRTAADSLLSQYGVEELKAMARQNNLPVGGTKIQLLMLLLKNQILIPM
jgi:hypothetical protein